ncbi:MAG: hypothetical protein LBU32_10335 [Clostridiales bacterium]|nr:hypothetical protein [Clostridiales bacterium]
MRGLRMITMGFHGFGIFAEHVRNVGMMPQGFGGRARCWAEENGVNPEKGYAVACFGKALLH